MGRAAPVLAAFLLLSLPGLPTPAAAAPSRASVLDSAAWADRDRQPAPKPSEGGPTPVPYYFREFVVEQISHGFDIPDKLIFVARALGAHTEREAVNVNAFDEVPNSSWFTNRNHVRAVPAAQMRNGPDSTLMPAKPWTITHPKRGGAGAGFRIKDAAGREWQVELDPLGHPQLSSGADMISRTLLHAAGYNVPHNEPVRFRREDLAIDPELKAGAEGESLDEAQLDTLLARGAVLSDGSYSGQASLWLSGEVLGARSSRGRRKGDLNDWYDHTNRRELRGLYVLCSWLGLWDTKDPNALDVFVAEGQEKTGYVAHYLLDVNGCLGAQATGPKELWRGYEKPLDFGWVARRVLTLGFVEEPWRRARQGSGIPAVGNFESEYYKPSGFAEYQNPAMHEMTDRDAYWGAKIVASFSDAQIAAAVDAGHYDDPRAGEYIVRNLIQRRDKVERHWFGRVAPLDFFIVQGGVLRFRDLAVDVGLERPRSYEVDVETEAGPAPAGSAGATASDPRHVRLGRTELPLGDLAAGGATHRILLELSVSGSGAKPARVELIRTNSGWVVTRVRHG